LGSLLLLQREAKVASTQEAVKAIPIAPEATTLATTDRVVVDQNRNLLSVHQRVWDISINLLRLGKEARNFS